MSAMLTQGGALGQSETAKVVITGGPDTTGQAYAWAIANQDDSPIVGVRIPHFRGGLFTPPEGWVADCTNLVGVGSADEPGICTANAGSPRYTVAKRSTATFRLQLAARGAKQGVGEILVRFADGTDVVVGRVMLPVRESLVEKLSSALGLAIIGALIITIRGRRRRRVRQTDDPGSSLS